MIFPQKKTAPYFWVVFFPNDFPTKTAEKPDLHKTGGFNQPGKAMIPPGSLIIDFAVPHVSEAARRWSELSSSQGVGKQDGTSWGLPVIWVNYNDLTATSLES